MNVGTGRLVLAGGRIITIRQPHEHVREISADRCVPRPCNVDRLLGGRDSAFVTAERRIDQTELFKRGDMLRIALAEP